MDRSSVPLPHNPVKYDANGNIVSYGRPSLWQKCKQEPLVPIGAIATVTALVMGVNAFQKGDRVKSQLMMRYRVGAQAATLGFLLFYFYKNEKEKENVPGSN